MGGGKVSIERILHSNTAHYWYLIILLFIVDIVGFVGFLVGICRVNYSCSASIILVLSSLLSHSGKEVISDERSDACIAYFCYGRRDFILHLQVVRQKVKTMNPTRVKPS